jgi:hypothetical protein
VGILPPNWKVDEPEETWRATDLVDLVDLLGSWYHERNDMLNRTCLSWACILFIDDQYNVGIWIGSMIQLIRFMRHGR